MIALRENQSKIWLKVLRRDGQPIDGTKERWVLPRRGEKGYIDTLAPISTVFDQDSWQADEGKQDCTWLVSDPKPYYQMNSDQVIYIAQLHNSPLHETEGMIWVNKVSLIREATTLDLKRFGIHKAFLQHI